MLTLAERVGFEPTLRYNRRPLFESGTLNHSDTSPSFEFYPKTSLQGKVANILLTNLSHLGLRESAADEAAPDSGQFLGSKAADELEPGRSTLAAAAILPLRLLGTKKAWMWLAVLVGIAIAGYFLWRWYSKRKKVTLPTNEQPKMHSGDPVRDFMDDYR